MQHDALLPSLVDMLEAIDAIQEYTSTVSLEDFITNRMMFDAVVRQFIILGEAANRIPTNAHKQFPHLPWMEMRGLRNFVVHQYDEVNRQTIWDTVQHDLPGLRSSIQDVLNTF